MPTLIADKIQCAASTASLGALFRLIPGVAPSSPVDGDIWTTSAGFYARINGSIIQFSTTAHATSHYPAGSDPVNAEPYHGFENRTASTLVWTNIDRTLTVTGTFVYYYQSNKITVSSSPSAQITNTVGLWYIYFNSGGTLTASQSFPSFQTSVLVAAVWWNGTTGNVYDERHGYARNLNWHLWAHTTIGARYGAGLSLTASGTGGAASFSSLSGNIWDEDIDFTVVASSSFTVPNAAILWYQTGASTFTFISTPSTVPFYWTGTAVRFVNSSSSYALTTLASNRYTNVWVYACNDINQPIHMVVETIAGATGYTSVANARAVSPPNLSGLGLAPEMKFIYRLVILGTGAVQTMIAADDYRNTSSLPAGGTASSSASSVSYAPTGGWITGTTIQTAIQQIETQTTITATQLVFGSGSSTLTSSANLTYDGSKLLINPIGATLTAAPTGSSVHICGGNGNAGVTRVLTDVFMGTGSGYAVFAGRAARGTDSAPTALQSGDEITNLSAWGYGATGYSAAARGYVSIFAAENWTDAAQGTRIGLWTTTPGGIITSEKIRIWGDGGLQLGGTFTASPGAGSLLVTSTTISTSVTSGAAVINGGLGVAGSIYVGSDISVSGTLIIKNVNEAVNAIGNTGAGTVTINCLTANRVTLTVTGNAALSFSNVPAAGTAKTMVLHITNGSAFVLSFPANTRWAGGIVPVLMASGLDIIGLTTIDGGSTWDAIPMALNSKVP